MKIEIERSVVQQVLEALGSVERHRTQPNWYELAVKDAEAITALREALAAPTGSGFDEAAVERALVELAWHEDGAQWPDAYSQDEQKMEREKMREALAAPGNQLDDINVADMEAPPQPAQQEPEPVKVVYIVATGETHNGQETYTRHDTRPPLCEFERLHSAPKQAAPNSVEIDKIETPERDTIAVNLLRHAGLDKHKARECAEIVLQVIDAANKPAQQEPAAWRIFDGEGGYEYRSYEMNETYAEDWAKHNPRHVGWVEPLYTATQPAQQLATLVLARKQADRIADLEAEVTRFRTDAMNEKAARQALEQRLAALEPLSKAKVDDFKHWLNARRMLSVSEAFHEIVECYEAAAHGITKGARMNALELAKAVDEDLCLDSKEIASMLRKKDAAIKMLRESLCMIVGDKRTCIQLDGHIRSALASTEEVYK